MAKEIRLISPHVINRFNKQWEEILDTIKDVNDALMGRTKEINTSIHKKNDTNKQR